MVRAIVTDIEGTTTSLSFVKDTLFPYARAHIGAYLRRHSEDPLVKQQLEAVSAETGRVLTLDESIAQLLAWIDADRKITPLKALQGMVWEAGYRNGAYQGHIYADARDRLVDWQARGVRLYVYSSGSVKAQQLLFAATAYGDLTPLFSGFFDTRIGAKVEATSYTNIAGEIGLPAGDILFLSDIDRELDAARCSGMQTCWLVRDGALDPAAAHRQVRDFNAVDRLCLGADAQRGAG
ncbi:MAG: acireductone synthase [Gammaproteobacteria bacterium]